MRKLIGTLLVFFGVSALICSVAWYLVVEVHGVPRQRRLGECTGTRVEVMIDWPRGSHHQLLLGIPGPGIGVSETSLHRVLGTLTLSQNGSSIAHWDLSREPVASTNWLQNHGIPISYALTKGRQMTGVLLTGGIYNVTLTLRKPLPPGSSLWLCWTSDPARSGS